MLLLVGGCRRESVVDRAARHYREQQEARLDLVRLQSARFARLSDGQLVRLLAVDGLGIVLRPERTELHPGEPLKLRLAFENIAATVPISATTCQGFTLAVEDETTGETTSTDLSFGCAKNDPLRDDDLPLPRGELQSVIVSTGDTSVRFSHPGNYLLTASWRSFQVNPVSAPRGAEYSVAESNRILVHVVN